MVDSDQQESEMIILYSTRCPRCEITRKKLETANIDFTLIEDFDVNLLIEKGFNSAPVLSVDGEMMDFKAANDWINTHKGE